MRAFSLIVPASSSLEATVTARRKVITIKIRFIY